MSRFARKVPRERPVYRNLRGYAFDPSLSIATDTADINNVVYKIRWEDLQGRRAGGYARAQGSCLRL